MFTEFGTNDPLTVKLWSKLTMREALHKTYLKRFMGTGPDAILQRVSDLEQSAGDTVKYDLLVQMDGYGVSGDNPLEGFEDGLTYFQDSVKVDQRRLGHAARRMSQLRTLHNIREDARSALADRWAAMWDELFIYQLTGYSPTGVPADFSAHAANTLTAPDANHKVTGTGWSDTELTVEMISKLKEKAATMSPMIRPTMVSGEPKYVLLVHPYSLTNLKTVSGSLWREVANAAFNGARTGHPLYTGAIGEWDGVVIHESVRIPIASNISYSLFMGAQSGVIAFGNPYNRFDQGKYGSDLMMSWAERERDYGNERGIGVGSVFGIKPCNFGNTVGGVTATRFGMIRAEIKAIAHA